MKLMVSDTHTPTMPVVVDRAVVESIARDAGKVALLHFHSLSQLPVESKGHLDLVTLADREVEALLTSRLLAAFPNDGVFGEEDGEVSGTTGRVWVIDPIDGTFNFVRGAHNWAISIGLFENNQPVFGVIYAPIRNLLLSGGLDFESQMNGVTMMPLPPLAHARGSIGLSFHPSVASEDRLEVVRFVTDDLRFTFRFGGSATLSLIELAMGETDGYISLGDSTWDVMAALAILRNLGVSDTIDWANTCLEEKLRFACGSGAFLEGIAPLLKRLGHLGDARDI